MFPLFIQYFIRSKREHYRRLWADQRHYKAGAFAAPLVSGQTGCRFLFAQFNSPIHRTPNYRFRHHNITLASRKFQNILVKPQQIVSFFKILGDISPRAGYLTSDFFLRDRWVMGPESGLDQFASALYYLALVAGLDIVEHHAAVVAPRSSGPEFIPMGFEACVYKPFFDLRFRNPFNFDIALQTQVSADQLAITLYAKEPPAHPTQLETEVIRTLPFGTENRSRKDPTFILGTAPKQGMNGCVLKVVRKVYDHQEVIETQTLFERTLAPVHEIVWVE